MKMEFVWNKLISATLGIIVVFTVASFFLGFRAPAEAAMKGLGIDFGEPERYIMNFGGEWVSDSNVQLSWIVPEGKGDLIEDYVLYDSRNPELLYEEKIQISESFVEWTDKSGLSIHRRTWNLANVNYGWHVFKLVAVTKTGEDEKEAAVWVPSVAEEACSAITDVHLRDDCYKKHVSEGRVDELLGKKICERLITTGNNKNDCYRWLAINTNKEEYCEEIQEHAYVSIYIDIRWKKVQNECYTKIAANKGDTAICEKITEKYEEQYRQREWDRCYLEVAKNAENKEACKKACEQIKDKYEKECYDECEKKPE